MSRNHKILSGLLAAEKENRLHHAYILSGPASVAKVSCVENFAATLFSRDGKVTETQALERIRQRNHPDFTRLENTEGDLGVNEMRELPRLLAFSPLEA